MTRSILLRPHQIFLKDRGYDITPVTNGDDAIAMVQKRGFDAVLLDEMMAGRDGLSTLAVIKDINPHIPVIMITKNEEERLMEQAIGQRIDDYLTKPVNQVRFCWRAKNCSIHVKFKKTAWDWTMRLHPTGCASLSYWRSHGEIGLDLHVAPV